MDEPSLLVEAQQYTFLSSMTTISISNGETSTARSAFRDAFVRRRPSITSINIPASSSERVHSFSFSLPESTRQGEEMPATFYSAKDPSSPDYFEVTYKVIADWEPNDPTEIPSQYVIIIPLRLRY